MKRLRADVSVVSFFVWERGEMRNQLGGSDVGRVVGFFVWERDQMRNQVGICVVTRRFGAEPFGRLRVRVRVGVSRIPHTPTGGHSAS